MISKRESESLVNVLFIYGISRLSKCLQLRWGFETPCNGFACSMRELQTAHLWYVLIVKLLNGVENKKHIIR